MRVPSQGQWVAGHRAFLVLLLLFGFSVNGFSVLMPDYPRKTNFMLPTHFLPLHAKGVDRMWFIIGVNVVQFFVGHKLVFANKKLKMNGSAPRGSLPR